LFEFREFRGRGPELEFNRLIARLDPGPQGFEEASKVIQLVHHFTK
jgi:hypothetical protein